MSALEASVPLPGEAAGSDRAPLRGTDEAPADLRFLPELRAALDEYPTGVAVVTSRDDAGLGVGTTAATMVAVSLDPPRLLVVLGRESRVLPALCSHERFAVSVLSVYQRAQAMRFDGPGGISLALRGRNGPPWVEGALAVIECRLDQVVVAGEQALVLGWVSSARTDGSPEPLVRHRGGPRDPARQVVVPGFERR